MFEPLNTKVSLIATNYQFQNSEEFKLKMDEKGLIEKYKLNSISPIKGEIPPKNILDQMQQFLPVIYSNDDIKLKLFYVNQEARLIIEKQNIENDQDFIFKNLTNDVVDFKLSDIMQIGINFFCDYNLLNTKLTLLNNNIETKFPIFNNNCSFELVIPIDLKERNLVSTYRINKLSKNNDKDKIYRISVNNHFDISELNTIDKAKKLKSILDQSLYIEFLENCQNILSMNNGEN